MMQDQVSHDEPARRGVSGFLAGHRLQASDGVLQFKSAFHLTHESSSRLSTSRASGGVLVLRAVYNRTGRMASMANSRSRSPDVLASLASSTRR
jgi:hypothetical protein